MSEHFFLLVSGVESHATQPIDRRSTHPGKTAVRAGVERGQVQTVPDPQGVHGEKDNGTGKTFAIPTNDGTGQTFGIPGRSLRQADQERVTHSLHLDRPWHGWSTASIRKRRSSDQGYDSPKKQKHNMYNLYLMEPNGSKRCEVNRRIKKNRNTQLKAHEPVF